MTSLPSPPDRRKAWWLIASLWCLLLALAAVRVLSVPDEGRYAEIGRWMLLSGDWLTPRLNGLPFFHKPPLLHWLQATSMAVFGVGPWAARLVPALHAGAMLVALYLAARQLAGETLARRAALMLGTSLAFLIGGQYVNHDMMVAAWIGIAIWAFALAFMHGERPHAGLARLGFAACALGVLSKGLIGLALPGLVLLAWLLWTRQFRKVLHLPWSSGLALFGAIAVPWFVLAQRHHPGLFDYLFGVQQFGRYTGKTFNNPEPWWFYIAAVFGLLFPWAFFALKPLIVGIKRRFIAPVSGADAWQALCWIWIVVIIAFFSVPRSKLVGYVLPVMPPLALLAALGWERVMAGRRHAGRWLAACAALALSLGVAVSLLSERLIGNKLSRDIAQTLACAAAPADKVYVVGGYPYDLPFLAQTQQPLIVVQDWPAARAASGDSWRRELFEGADFDPAAAGVLQTPDVLPAASRTPGRWLVAPRAMAPGPWQDGWRPVQQGRGWTLYRSSPATGSAPERPEAAEHKGLPGCHDQGRPQRQQ